MTDILTVDCRVLNASLDTLFPEKSTPPAWVSGCCAAPYTNTHPTDDHEENQLVTCVRCGNYTNPAPYSGTVSAYVRLAIASLPGLKEELISAAHLTQAGDATLVTAWTLTGAAHALGCPMTQAEVSELTLQTLNYRKEAYKDVPSSLTWHAHPPFTPEKARDFPGYPEMMRLAAQIREGEHAVMGFITGWLLACGMQRHILNYGEISAAAFEVEHPQLSSTWRVVHERHAQRALPS